jgi:nucleotide-binding universal stress UspA family protein
VYELDQYLIKGKERRSSPGSLADSGRQPVGFEKPFTEAARQAMCILAYLPAGGASVTLRLYAEYLSCLLHGQLTCLSAVPGEPINKLERVAADFDLLLYGEPERPPLDRVLFGSSGRRVTSKMPTTILVAQHPHWPICRILLVIRVAASEELAVDWAGRLAQSSGAHLTILPLVAAQPLIYGCGSQLQVGIESLLTPNTPCGKQLRSFLRLLQQWRVNGTLRVRQGEPLGQICWEIDEGQYDLVIIGAEQSSRWRRWLFGDLVGPLISRVNRPILIAGASRPGSVRAEEVGKEKEVSP